MKRILSVLLCAMMILSLAACGNTSSAPAASDATAATVPAAAEDTYVVGICQLVQHEALDAATQGFEDALKEALGDKVTFEEQNASGDSANCSTICNQFASEGVDLILANATPALQAAAAVTSTIPILGTSVTDYASALDIEDWNGTTGLNISGTSDLAPLTEQAAMLTELFPDAEKVGILYCSAEANSVYQANVVRKALEEKGLEVELYTFSDSNDIANVTEVACSASDVIYIPTDNTAASCTGTIQNVALPAGVPIVTGDEGICSGCGIATLCINYYDLGYATGKMAVKVLTEGVDVSTLPVEFAPQPIKKYNSANSEALNIAIPADYVAIG